MVEILVLIIMLSVVTVLSIIIDCCLQAFGIDLLEAGNDVINKIFKM